MALWQKTLLFFIGVVALSPLGHSQIIPFAFFKKQTAPFTVSNGDFESNNLNGWITELPGNDLDWSIESSDVGEGTYSAKPGAIGHNGKSCIAREIDLSNHSGFYKYSFLAKARSELYYDPLDFYINEDHIARFSDHTPYHPRQGVIEGGQYYFFKWCFTKDSGSTESDNIFLDSFSINLVTSSTLDQTNVGFESNNFSGWMQNLGDASNWTITSSDKSEGTYAAVSGSIGHLQSSCVARKVDLSISSTHYDFSFDWKVSSQSGGDYLVYYINGAEVEKISGTVGWTTVNSFYPLSKGQIHYITWCYLKNSGTSSGSDQGLIDNFSLSSVATAPLNTTNLDFESNNFSNWDHVAGDDGNWAIETSNIGEGTYSARSNANASFEYSCVDRTLDLAQESGAWLLDYIWDVDSEAGFDFGSIRVNLLKHAKDSGRNKPWTRRTVKMEAGRSYHVRWCYEKDFSTNSGSDRFYIDKVQLSQYTAGYDTANLGFESNNLSSWQTSSQLGAQWAIDTGDVQAGTYSAVSGNIGNNEAACIRRIVDLRAKSSDHTIEYYWKVSSEANDHLKLYQNGQEIQSISGTVGWNRVTRNLKRKRFHILEWCYEKNNTTSSGTDEGWIDSMTVSENTCQGDGVPVGGTCWYLGKKGESCDTVCTPYAGVNAATTTFAGSSGSNANCQEVLDMFDTENGAVSTSSNARGCQYNPASSNNRRGTTATTNSSSNSNWRRACSCSQ